MNIKIKKKAENQIEHAASRWVEACLIHIQYKQQKLKEKGDEKPKQD